MQSNNWGFNKNQDKKTNLQSTRNISPLYNPKQVPPLSNQTSALNHNPKGHQTLVSI